VPVSERAAAELREAIQALTRLRAMIEEHRAVDEERLNQLVSAVSELDVPKELIEVLGAVAEGRRGYLAELGELLDGPIVMLEETLGSITTQQGRKSGCAE
jgi:hypothetical protein